MCRCTFHVAPGPLAGNAPAILLHSRHPWRSVKVTRPLSTWLARRPTRRASPVDRALVTTASTRVSSSGRARRAAGRPGGAPFGGAGVVDCERGSARARAHLARARRRRHCGAAARRVPGQGRRTRGGDHPGAHAARRRRGRRRCDAPRALPGAITAPTAADEREPGGYSGGSIVSVVRAADRAASGSMCIGVRSLTRHISSWSA